jgi:hypothetical protein
MRSTKWQDKVTALESIAGFISVSSLLLPPPSPPFPLILTDTIPTSLALPSPLFHRLLYLYSQSSKVGGAASAALVIYLKGQFPGFKITNITVFKVISPLQLSLSAFLLSLLSLCSSLISCLFLSDCAHHFDGCCIQPRDNSFLSPSWSGNHSGQFCRYTSFVLLHIIGAGR